MNKKAEIFLNYLDEKKIENVFAIEEMPNDDWESSIFRSNIDIGGNKLPVGVILDNSIYGMIRILIAPNARTDENELAVLRVVNEYNKKYKSFKYYFDDKGSLVLDICILSAEGERLGDLIYAMFDVIINHLNESYKEIMHAIWA
ncbi:hypothetical protein [Schwartzia succinivorans]|jgi:hypothetical protein|uniref:Sensory transduction regulator n=1 Tax=Schwartzia succinivorans DSM 10502 TaxID=1123243 RepID=A0A1M4TAP8_9FIRM|nr:hypothetical protein [Schwartzia succinivorans]MBQ1469239.1 hypothetical protein [Schwartzia sp. (in: firmicutes)]MBQ1919026.1 hypothetical protein [Schwartzia sp. (in: firmicutes)]MBQ2047829.1 hypothetical protein [Schwartzia sp. (in: firmicutes)]MBQ3863794.1 hypothetical protein [Schwartzia sp. (in: firmicutes)]SHE41505.1 hypothetical protein SAMN02745190_00420 [Schwartzia succinivorans DSM 10502]